MKNRFLTFAFIFLSVISCGENDEAPTEDDCAGQVCEATPGANETATTVQATLHGTYNMIITFAESNSPYPEGTRATFTISETKLAITIAGEDCFSIMNPVTRSPFSAPVFKADCIGDLAFQIAANSSGGVEEINMIFASGPGYYGQFRVEE